MKNYILTPGGVTLILKNRPVEVASSDSAFEAVVEAIKANKDDKDIEAILFAEKNRLEAASRITDDLRVEGGVVMFKDEALPDSLSARMLDMLKEGYDLTPMVKFVENLMQNPHFGVVPRLHAFLEKGKMPITEDGCFLAYKAVRGDFLDIRSGTMDNSVGNVVEIPRRKVDPNQDQTCSYGLHVCSFGYLKHFARPADEGHVVVCKVNPQDVVAIPRDYNDTKMRVCRYEVIDEYEGYYTNGGDALSGMSVASSTSMTPAPKPKYEVRVSYTDFDGDDGEMTKGFNSLTEAAEFYQAVIDGDADLDADIDGDPDEVTCVTLVNLSTGAEVESYNDF
jgi:hypothetical protein